MKKTFILSKSAAHIHFSNKNHKTAFTLAETLTTLIVIGFIAIITLPILNSSVDDKTKNAQKNTFNVKLKQGLSNMQIHGALADEYETTADFIKTMQRYMNITKTCSADNLSNCFASKIKESQSSTKFVTSNIRTSADIKADWVKTSDLGAVVFTDGTSAIIAHNPDCVITNKFDTTTDTTACFAMIYDINGNNSPNIIGTDIDTINLDYGDYGHEIVIGTIFSPSSYTKEQCLEAKDNGAPINDCWFDNDYWAMAVDKCFQEGKKLPSSKQMKDIAIKLYGENVSLSGKNTDLKVVNQDIWYNLGSASASLWSGTENNARYAAVRCFAENYTESTGCSQDGYRANSSHKAFCIDK